MGLNKYPWFPAPLILVLHRCDYAWVIFLISIIHGCGLIHVLSMSGIGYPWVNFQVSSMFLFVWWAFILLKWVFTFAFKML